MTTKAQALKLYERACETHKRADWRLACHAMAAHLGAATPAPREARPVSLVAFLARAGLHDEGGEVTARDGDRWHRDAAFRRKLVRPDGLSLEAAAERAYDAGYFPDVAAPDMDGAENMTAVTADALVAAIDRELSGRPVYAIRDQDQDESYWESMEPEERAWA